MAAPTPVSRVPAIFRQLFVALTLGYAVFAGVAQVSAQESSLAIRMVPVVVMMPELQLTAAAGSTNALQMATQFGAWQDISTFVFTNPTITVVDQIPRGSRAFYRLRRVIGSTEPPFPPPLTNLVWIPPGQFVIGSPDDASDPDAASEEQPQTEVTLSKGFFIGKYEVTQGEYLLVTNANPSAYTGDPNLPVESLNWEGATNYCHLLNLRESLAGRLPAGYAYRLPTEAEWEYAARAGSATRFSWGNDLNYALLSNYAWYSANSEGSTHPVGLKLPNAWGLYDISGNVCEWCQDGFANYPGGAVMDLQGPTTGTVKNFRGGSHADDGVSCRAADRKSINQATALNIFGLRVVLAPTSP